MGAGVRYAQGSRTMGRRIAQHVETDAARGAVVSRRQSAPVAPLFAVPVAATQSAYGRHCHAGFRAAADQPHDLVCAVARMTLSPACDGPGQTHVTIMRTTQQQCDAGSSATRNVTDCPGLRCRCRISGVFTWNIAIKDQRRENFFLARVH